MTWEEMVKKHMKEWEEFEILKQQAWDKMQKRHTEILAATKADSEESWPPSVKATIPRERDQWIKEWGNMGEKMKTLKASQVIEEKEFLKQKMTAFKITKNLDDGIYL